MILASCLFFNLRWFSHRSTSFNIKRFPVLHSIAFCTVLYRLQSVFSSEGTKLEITSANEIPTDERDGTEGYQGRCRKTDLHNIKLTYCLYRLTARRVVSVIIKLTLTPVRLLVVTQLLQLVFLSELLHIFPLVTFQNTEVTAFIFAWTLLIVQ